MKVIQEAEGLSSRRVSQAGLLLLGLSILSVIAAALVLVPRPGALARGQPRPHSTLGEPAHIETAPFPRAAASSSRAAARAHLARYGWVDRSAGVVHVPIERAMDLYLATARAPAGAP